MLFTKWAYVTAVGAMDSMFFRKRSSLAASEYQQLLLRTRRNQNQDLYIEGKIEKTYNGITSVLEVQFMIK